MITMEDGENMFQSQLEEFFITGTYTDAKELVGELCASSRETICSLVSRIEQKNITTSTIPQYSSFDDGTVNLIQFLRMAGNFGPSYLEVGRHYLENGHTERAYIKYGENHAKVSELLGTTTIKKEDRKRVYLNEIGYEIEKLSTDKQHECFIKLSGRIPIVQYAIKNDIVSDRDLEEVLGRFLSPSTALRRRRNTWYLISALRGDEN